MVFSVEDRHPQQLVFASFESADGCRIRGQYAEKSRESQRIIPPLNRHDP
jgi:hypothetical protein